MTPTTPTTRDGSELINQLVYGFDRLIPDDTQTVGTYTADIVGWTEIRYHPDDEKDLKEFLQTQTRKLYGAHIARKL